MSAKKILIIFSLSMTFLFAFSIAIFVAIENDHVDATPTEAPGGIIGTGVDELRCPPNLTGMGPTWNEISVGVSSIDDLAQFFGQMGSLATPYPIYAGDFAPNYEFASDDFGTVYACVVDKKVAALLIDRHALSNSYLPRFIEQWVSFLGTPTLVSWHEYIKMRLVHWPQFGTSIAVYLYEGTRNKGDTEWVYLYPFRQADYENLWPINSIWKGDIFADILPDATLDVLDFQVLQATVTAGYLWPSVTPRATDDFSIRPTGTPSP